MLSLTFVVLDDGSERICPHPCERRVAEEVTNTSWALLEEANRIIYRQRRCVSRVENWITTSRAIYPHPSPAEQVRNERPTLARLVECGNSIP